jgi:hypothetical protein
MPPQPLPNSQEQTVFSEGQKAIFILAAGPIGWTITGILAYFVSPSPSEYATTLVVQMCGIALGWLLAFFASPRDEEEQATFSVYAKILSAFVSGYLLSKIEPLITAVLNADLLKSQIPATRLLIFVTSMALAVMNGYSYRLYYHFRPKQTQRPKMQNLQTSANEPEIKSEDASNRSPGNT